ncbi:MAG: Metallothionein expression activator [Caeruleum heppii]|nr:MAG: Metallothionein expression activator [Caeruleum heppii]
MLSNPNSSLHQRQRQHRRQNSTPTALTAPKVPLLPATTLQRQGSHRRGQSLDQRPAQWQQRGPPTQQDTRTVSTTNPGLQQQQHILQETQQHRLARPGQQNQQYLNIKPQPSENNSPGYFDGCFNSAGDGALNNHVPLQRSQSTAGHGRFNRSGNRLGRPGTSIAPIASHSPVEPAGNLDGYGLGLGDTGAFVQNGQTRGGTIRARPISYHGGSSMSESQWCRPAEAGRPMLPTTPPEQIVPNVYPLTPENTPHQRLPQTEPAHRRKKSGLSLSQDETIKPSTYQKAIRKSVYNDFFEDIGYNDNGSDLPTPPNTGPMSTSHTMDLAPMPTPNFMNMSSLNMNFSGSDQGYDSSYYSPMSAALSPSQSSFLSSPEMEQLQLFDHPLEKIPDFGAAAGVGMLPVSQSSVDLSGSMSPTKGSMPARANSVADLNLDASIEDTGVTLDEISTFIEGPDMNDGKWLCLFPDCKKRFGRKENIKSHVQTHLGDRQYRCNHCKKCFVRQHDLKRHAKIHSGVKPYPCLCGNSFARHDALTRHRQRGMCIGAFEGVVKKVVKRGRPRKNRPEDEERRDKADRTRAKAVAMSASSSTSGMSDQSYYDASSPPAQPTDFSNRSLSPFNLLTEPFPSEASATAIQHAFTHTPPMSPGRPMEAFVSPQHLQHSPSSIHSVQMSPQRSITSIPEEPVILPMQQGTPTPSNNNLSRGNSPPELYLESSSPPSSKLFEMTTIGNKIGSSEPSDQLSPLSMDPPTDLNDFMDLPDMMSQQVDDMFLDFEGTGTASGSLPTFEKSNPALLMLGKMDDGSFSAEDFFSDDAARGEGMFF